MLGVAGVGISNDAAGEYDIATNTKFWMCASSKVIDVIL
jgi:hypothetical protein